jgi:hypothetical protein
MPAWLLATRLLAGDVHRARMVVGLARVDTDRHHGGRRTGRRRERHRPGHPRPGEHAHHAAPPTPHARPGALRFRGRFCYVDAVLSGRRQPQPILRLRYQGSADRWDIGIYLASDERYTESELPTSFGPKTGFEPPEQGIDHTFILYAGPSTDTTIPISQDCETQDRYNQLQ